MHELRAITTLELIAGFLLEFGNTRVPINALYDSKWYRSHEGDLDMTQRRVDALYGRGLFRVDDKTEHADRVVSVTAKGLRYLARG